MNKRKKENKEVFILHPVLNGMSKAPKEEELFYG
jgi:hypothetical protein